MTADPELDAIFQRIAAHLAVGDPQVIGLGAVYRFALGSAGSWIVDAVRQPGVRSDPEERERAECTVHCSAATFKAIAGGRENPQVAFLQGGLTVSGDMSASLRLAELFSALQRQVPLTH